MAVVAALDRLNVIDRHRPSAALVALHVAGRAVPGRPLEVALEVAGFAAHLLVRAGQSKAGCDVVEGHTLLGERHRR